MKKIVAPVLLVALCIAAVSLAACTPPAASTAPSTGTQPSQSMSQSTQTLPTESTVETTVSTAPPPTVTQHVHAYENWIIIKKQSCVSKELSTGTCSCGQTYTVATKEPTGIHTYNEIGDCSGCGRHISLGLEYILSEDESHYIVTGPGTCLEEHLVIDDSYEGKPVAGIGDNAFAGCDFLKSVTMPDTLGFLGEAVFAGCKNLQQVAIPDSVTKLGNGIFDSCAALDVVSLPKGLEALPEGMFTGCGLREVYLPEAVREIGAYVFLGCDRLQTIHFAGTLQDWESVILGENWIDINRMPVIICSDGIVEEETPEPDTEQG